MNRFIWVAIIVSLVGRASATQAQPPAPGRPLGLDPATNPPVSPYLNLVRPGSSPAINYYGIVRPQVDLQQSLQGLQSQVLGVQQAQDMLRAGDSGTTGHPAYFLNYGGGFLKTTGRPPANASLWMGERTGASIGQPPTSGGYGIARPFSR